MTPTDIPQFRGTVVPEGARKSLRATLHVTASEVVATTEEGQRHAIAFEDLKLDLGGHNNRFLYCKARGGQGPSFATEDQGLIRTLRAADSAALAPVLESISGQRARDRIFKRSYWGCLGGAVVAVGLAALVLVILTPALLSLLLNSVPIEVDEMIGESAYEDMDWGGEAVTDPRIVSVVDEMIQRIGEESAVEGFTFRVDVIDSDVVNAFALPGGQVVVYTGLLDRADSAEQVAGVLAHEIAHVTLRHGMRQTVARAGLGLAVFLVLGDISGWLVLAGETAAVVASNSYSRSQESDADAEGARMLAAAGLEPRGLIEFFEMLKKEPDSGLPSELSWLSTHPEHQERIDHINDLLPDLTQAKRRPLEGDWDALKGALDER